MNKKIIAISIICMFFLLSMTGLIVVGKEIKTLEPDITNFEDLPDLVPVIDDYDITEDGFCIVKIYVKNIGKVDWYCFNLELTLDSNKATQVITMLFSVSEIQYIPIKYDKLSRPHELTAIADAPFEGHPNGIVEESDETNNEISIEIKPRAKSALLSGNDYPFICLVSKFALRFLDKSLYYKNKNIVILEDFYVYLFAILICYLAPLLELKGIETFEELDCHCAWNSEDFPNIPSSLWE